MTGKVGFSMKRVLSIVCVGLILLLGGLCVVQTARPGLLGRVWRRVFPEKPTAAAVIVPDEDFPYKQGEGLTLIVSERFPLAEA